MLLSRKSIHYRGNSFFDMFKVLVIEDDASIAHSLALYIKNEGYEEKHCADGLSAMDTFQAFRPELIILDINLPGKSGIDVCREIRSVSDVPIIVLSARGSEPDKLLLFELGVDDYVLKPFSARELMARITAVRKRIEAKKKPKKEKSLVFGSITIDPHTFSIDCPTQDIVLTKTEFSILEYCIQNADGVIKREGIMKDVMGYDNYVYDRTIDTHIKNLRKKLESCITIETLRGI